MEPLWKLLYLLEPAPVTLILTAVAVTFGSAFRALNYGKEMERNRDLSEASIMLDKSQALMIPVMSSCSLLLMFYMFSSVSQILTALTAVASVSSLFFCLSPYIAYVRSHFGLADPFVSRCCSKSFTRIQWLILLACTSIVAAWLVSGHWILNNLLGIAICIAFVSHVRLPNIKICAMLLACLFVYDIFWVFFSERFFGANVMVSVATQQASNPVHTVANSLSLPGLQLITKKLELPVKIVFPRNLFGGVTPGGHATDFMMLGLGDMAMPAMLLALVLCFDHRKSSNTVSLFDLHSSKGHKYIWYALPGYAIGLITALSAGVLTHSPQPALLYLVPSTLGPVIVMSWLRKDLAELWEGTLPVATLSEVVVHSSIHSNINGHSHLLHPPNSMNSSADNKKGRRETFLLAYKTLGVVFGGLVTSPLYVYPSMPLKSPTEEDYLGIYSIMFWTLTLIGVVKYASIALKADDQGEGGTFALYSKLCRNMDIGFFSAKSMGSNYILHEGSNSILHGGTENKSRLGKFFEKSIVARRILLFIAMLGMCMLIGDGILTPAISVLSAMDGIRARFPSVSKSWVEALSAIVLIVLFLLQKFGTSRVSFLFSPIMGAWTFCTPLVGIYSIISHYPGIFKALSPHYIIHFFSRNGKEGWLLLGGTVLCITGSEALFADLGHFNRSSIQIAFLFTIYPSLVLTYAGQTAYLIRHPNDHDDGFYKFIPRPVYWPIFIIATSAAVVASQSLISATFSVIKQSVVLDYFPRVKVVHTSSNKEGEVYSPEVNYILMILCVAVILIFGDGKDIGNAFGVVVSLVMLITTILLTLVMIMVWRTPPLLVALYFLVFFTMEGVYVSAVCTKIPEGGWIPFAISFFLAFIMFGWFYGRQRKVEYELTHRIDLGRLRTLLSVPGVQRVPGLCFFYTNIQDGLTPILGHYIKNMRSLHKVAVFTTLRYLLVPKVAPEERVVVKRLGLEGVYGCVIQYGYADSLNLEGSDFVNQVTDCLREYIENYVECLPSNPVEIQEEISALEEAKLAGVVHIRGKTRFYIGKNCNWFDRIMLAFYEVLHSNCRSALPALGVPLPQRIEVGMLYEA